jgi:hypothetical protein
MNSLKNSNKIKPITNNIEYTIKYFINKFENTKEEDWRIGRLKNKEGQKCAVGHIMKYNPEGNFSSSTINSQIEVDALINIFLKSSKGIHSASNVNDNKCGTKYGVYSYLGNTPRQRILNFLYQELHAQPLVLK